MKKSIFCLASLFFALTLTGCKHLEESSTSRSTASLEYRCTEDNSVCVCKGAKDCGDMRNDKVCDPDRKWDCGENGCACIPKVGANDNLTLDTE